MITYKQINEDYFEKYDSIPMIVHVKSIFTLEKIQNGLGGILFKEIPVAEYQKDYSIYQKATQYAKKFDITNWAFFMAFDRDIPIGAATVVSKTANINMLDGRDDLSVLWDLRVDNSYKGQGIGTKLFTMTTEWSKANHLTQMKIECQNINVTACKFYHNRGATLEKIDEYAYYGDSDLENEVQFIWYLDL